MNDLSTAPSQTDAIDLLADGEASPLVGRQFEILGRLAEVGLEVALAIERQVKAADPAQPVADLSAAAEAYARVSRAVRLCILLQDALAKGRQDPGVLRRQAEALRRKEHTGRAVSIVRRVARDHCGHEPFAVSAIAKEAAERLDTDDIYGLVDSRPVGELVALICRDFGLDPNWAALAEEAWAQEELAGGAVGWPWRQTRPPPLAGEVSRSDGGRMPQPPSIDEVCEPGTSPLERARRLRPSLTGPELGLVGPLAPSYPQKEYGRQREAGGRS
jgi:hypothetical protein